MKKVIGQTVRDLKRGVNKKVLKVPGIEQKVLDATSNEAWGPHGSLLADIAQASKNYHEYQMIMAVLWKRINDTGKNWRHVYKGLTVLEYLVAHGSERVIDDIKDHAYQISTLSDFQYIDSSGRDQGSNVRKKSQNLVVLVNDKEKIIEVRQKAAANRERFRSPSAGGMYRPGSSGGGYGDRYDDDHYEGRYGSRDEERNGYGRERENNYRDDDKSGKYWDSYNRDGAIDDERCGRDGYRDDEYRGRSLSIDGYSSRGRSSDRDRGCDYGNDGQVSYRARADDQSQDGRGIERKYSEQDDGAPPSYEEALNDARSPTHSEKNGDSSAPSGMGDSSLSAPQSSSPPAPQASQSANNNAIQEPSGFGSSVSPANQEVVADEFDPRGSFAAFPTATAVPAVPAASTTGNNAEMDLLGSLSESFGPLAVVPASSPPTASEVDIQPSFSGPSFASTQPQSTFPNQGFEDPFGDTPFKAAPSTEFIPEQQQTLVSAVPLQNAANQYPEPQHASISNREMEKSLTFGDPASNLTYSAPNFQSTSTNSQFLPQELSSSNQEIDILADILPPSGPSGSAPQTGFPAQNDQTTSPGGHFYGNFSSQTGPTVPSTAPDMSSPTSQFSSGNYLAQGGFMGPTNLNMAMQNPPGPATQFSNGYLLQQSGYGAPVAHQIPQQMVAGPSGQLNNGNMFPNRSSSSSMYPQVASLGSPVPNAQQNPDVLGGLFAQGTSTSVAPQPSQTLGGSQPSLSCTTGALVPVVQPSKEKFETKSTVWADTLNRGLVNLNISGPKTNPLSDIGIDFDAINRKEKRMEKPTTTTATSTVTMGKAMGSGSGMGRAGATAVRPATNLMTGPPGGGMGMGGVPGSGMGGVPGSGMGIGMSGGPPSMGMGGSGGYGGGMNPAMGMGGASYGGGMAVAPMGMGLGQGAAMQPDPRGSSMVSGYNNMMGGGGYPQQPYGGGFQ